MDYNLVQPGRNNASTIFDLYLRFISSINMEYYEHALNTTYLMYCLTGEMDIDQNFRYKLLYITLLHDIGMFERSCNESVNKLITSYCDDHSVKSYLYVKYYTPFKDLADIVLYHHASFKANRLTCENAYYAYLLNLVDRFCVVAKTQGVDLAFEHLEMQRNNLYDGGQIDFLKKVFNERNCLKYIQNKAVSGVLRNFLSLYLVSNKELYEQVSGLAFIYEKYDEHQIGHSFLVGFLSNKLAHILDLSEEDCELVTIAGIAHDYGKIMLKNTLLKKAFKLTPEERALHNQHVVNSLKIIDGYFDERVYQAIKYHHERLDGSGYPYGVTEEHIPLFSRILTAVNRYTVIYEKRTYQGKIDFEAIMNELYDLADKAILDRKLVDVINCNKEQFGLEYQKMMELIHNTKKNYNDEYCKITEERNSNHNASHFVKTIINTCPYIDNKNPEVIFDALTNVFSRTSITKYVEYLIDNEKPFTLALCDVDNFKNVNDKLGHLVGDDVLAKFAKSLVNAVGDVAAIGRYGGDEFMIVIPDTVEYQDIWNLFHSVNSEINALTFEDMPDLIVTATTGAARYPLNSKSYKDLLEACDKALYRGKLKGRNCFIIYSDEKHKDIVREVKTDLVLDSNDVHLEIFKRLTASDNIYSSFRDLSRYLSNLFAGIYISLENEGTSYFEFYSENFLRKNREALPQRLTDNLFAERDYFYTNSTRGVSNKYSYLKAYMEDNIIDALVLVKISAYGKTFGYLRIDAVNSRLWQSSDIDFCITVANTLGVILALSNKKLNNINN